MDKRILAYEYPNDFKSRRARVCLKEDKAFIDFLEPSLSFRQMRALRSSGLTLDSFLEKISSGYVFANIGVSGILTVSIKGEDYLALVEQRREDFKDLVLKLVSGYVNSKHSENPEQALLDEISEEILPVSKGNRVLRFAYRGKPLSKPFQDYFSENDSLLELSAHPRFSFSDMERKQVFVNGNRMDNNPQVYFHLPSNSCQLVFGYHITGNESFSELEVSLNHSEDRLNEREKRIEKVFHPAGVSLVKLRRGRLTSEVYIYLNGNLFQVYPEKLTLSEAFAEKQKSVIIGDNIRLTDYLRINS